MQQQNKHWQQQFQQSQLETSQVKQRSEQQIKEFQAEKNHLQLLVAQKQELTIQLEEQRKNMQEQLEKYLEQSKVENDELKQGIQVLHQQIQEQSQQLHALNQQSKDKDIQLQQLNQQNEEKDQSLLDKDRQMQEINQAVEEQNQELQTTKQDKEELLRLSEEKDSQLHQLRQQNADLMLQVQQPSWVMKKKDIIVCDRELGRGAYGWVKEATFQGCKVAVKCLHNYIISRYNLDLFNREMSMAARCRHPNLLQFIGATSRGDGTPYIVTELMHTSLRRLLEHEELSSDHIIPIMLGVALGLNYLHKHEPPILHRDVSSANVLLNPLPCNQWFAKLSDFGSLNFLQQSQTVNAGNPVYAAPEALDPKRGSHTPAMDTFSFGVLLHELCSRTQPLGGLTPENFKYSDWKAPESELVALIISCINQEIGKRPMMDTVVAQLKALMRSQ